MRYDVPTLVGRETFSGARHTFDNVFFSLEEPSGGVVIQPLNLSHSGVESVPVCFSLSEGCVKACCAEPLRSSSEAGR